MVTRHYIMNWNLDTCVGCQIGPEICPWTPLTMWTLFLKMAAW